MSFANTLNGLSWLPSSIQAVLEIRPRGQSEAQQDYTPPVRILCHLLFNISIYCMRSSGHIVYLLRACSNSVVIELCDVQIAVRASVNHLKANSDLSIFALFVASCSAMPTISNSTTMHCQHASYLTKSLRVGIHVIIRSFMSVFGGMAIFRLDLGQTGTRERFSAETTHECT